MSNKSLYADTSFDYRVNDLDGQKMSMILAETMIKSRLDTSKLSK